MYNLLMFYSIKEYFLNDATDSHSLQRTIFQLIIISFLSILVFLNIFQNTFVVDDSTIFTNWPAIKNMEIGKILQGNYPGQWQEKVYRPVKGVIFSIEYKLWGQNKDFYHAQAIILNLTITLLIFFIIKNITRKSSIAFISALLFGIHPVHTEAITFLTASLDTWGILFFFLAFYFYIKRDKNTYLLFFSLFFAFLAFFTYELTLTLPIIIVFYDVCFKKINKKDLKKKLISYGCFILLFGLFFALRIYFIGFSQQGEYFAGSFYLTMLTMTKAIVKYLEVFVFPINLSMNPVLSGGIQSYINGFTSLDPIKNQKIFDLDIASSILLITIIIGAGFYLIKKKPIISFSIFFIFISLLPVLNILPLKIIMAERYGYISSFGVVLLAGIGFSFLYNFKYKNKLAKNIVQNLLIIILIMVIFFLSFLTIKRNTDWKDDISIWTALANQKAGKTIENSYLGVLYFQKGEYDKATASFKQVIAENGDVKFANYFLTFISVINAINQEDKQTAEKLYDKLLKLSLPSDKESLKNLKRDIDNISSTFNKDVQENELNTLIYKSQNFSFNYPTNWTVLEKNNEVSLLNLNKTFFIQIKHSKMALADTVDNYIKNQNQEYGTLINQGLAQIPNVDYAYVRIWNENGISKMQFFLFKQDLALEVIVWPSNSSEMETFNNIISSLKFH